MMKIDKLKSLIELNTDIDKYVIMSHTKEDFEILRNILVDLDYYPSIPLDTLENMMNNFVADNGYDCAWRISKRMGIAWNNQSIEWWRENSQFDIINICSDGTVQIIDKDSTIIPVIHDSKPVGYYFYNNKDLK